MRMWDEAARRRCEGGVRRRCAEVVWDALAETSGYELVHASTFSISPLSHDGLQYAHRSHARSNLSRAPILVWRLLNVMGATETHSQH
jgi:hypothetical protein|mmetsp:Transcript_73240/g.162644  ORF Transcript_73240/g.162644 Transcript_73240/m.162644 type:complete len:88 (+) Transcript_73240:168-431(+)